MRVRDAAKLARLADAWKTKYDWPWTVRDGAVPSQTRWRFGKGREIPR